MGSLSQTAAPQIPTVDLTKDEAVLKHGSSGWVSACNQIRSALEEYGCMVVLYDKLSPEFRKDLFGSLEQLFELPQETKMKNFNPKPAHGYMGKISAFPIHEGMGIEYATDLEECEKFSNLMWPHGNDRFCEIAHSYANMVAELERVVTRMLFESYGIGEKQYEAHVKSTTYLLRFLKYRRRIDHQIIINSADDDDGEKRNLGFTGHTDKSFISILHSNHVKGLQLRTKDDAWLYFEPSPSSFIVIVGDVCMAWSNDRIKSCYHRVIVNTDEVRYALGMFKFLTGVIEPPEELVDGEHPLQYKPFHHDTLLNFYQSSNDANKGERNMMKLFCGL